MIKQVVEAKSNQEIDQCLAKTIAFKIKLQKTLIKDLRDPRTETCDVVILILQKTLFERFCKNYEFSLSQNNIALSPILNFSL